MTSAPSTHSSLIAADCAPGSVLYGEIVEFLYREAELLDSNRFGDWLGLLAEDIHYVMPVRTTQFRAKGEGFQDVAFFEENFGVPANACEATGDGIRLGGDAPVANQAFYHQYLGRSRRYDQCISSAIEFHGCPHPVRPGLPIVHGPAARCRQYCRRRERSRHR